jgi:hypothetical protein
MLKLNTKETLKKEIIALTRLSNNDNISLSKWFTLRNTIRAKQKQLSNLGA